MSVQESIYRITKRAVNALPAGLLRARPFGVYSVPLSARQPEPCTVDDEHGEWQFRWLTTTAEKSAIASMVDAENLDNWNGTSRRVAFAWRRDADTGQEQPLGGAWISLDTFEEPQLGLCFKLTDKQAWLHSSYVPAAWRNRHVYRALLQFVIRTLADEGFEQLLMGISLGNEPSLRSHQAVGATAVGRIVAVRSLGLSCCTTKGNIHLRSARRVTVGQKLHLSVDCSTKAEAH